MILCAIDDRPAVSVPVVMVSTHMQGGCICENCSDLRVGTNNIEFASLVAPRPQAMIAANDWTFDLETNGLPQIKSIYRLYGAEDKVTGKHFSFEHNYNQVSREFMYQWVNRWLNLGYPTPVKEKPFVPLKPQEMSVYDNDHVRPADSVNAEKLRAYMTATSDAQIAALREFARISESGRRSIGGNDPGSPAGARDRHPVLRVGIPAVRGNHNEKRIFPQRWRKRTDSICAIEARSSR